MDSSGGGRGLDDALARVRRAERTLAALQKDYLTITSSRLYGLHLLLERLVPLRRQSANGRQADPYDPESYERLRASWSARVARRTAPTEPVVTIVIPAYNHCAVTMRCLQSIADVWFDSLAVQVVLADDASTDETGDLELPGLDVVRNRKNLGFVGTCNAGARIARGRYICFLNNDTTVRNAWLDELVATAESDPSIGIVGAKLLYPGGELQEAGGIIFRDGSGANYGRGGDPLDSRYNYRRDTDYVSGAAFLVRSALFHQLGGFSSEFAPAYYEDTDLCFAARAAGYRVVYEPRSEIVHHEGLSSGTDLRRGVKRHQAINRPKFARKWRGVLESHYENAPESIALAARRIRRGQTILVIDSYVPLHDREAGSNRLFGILRILREGGFHVLFLPDNYAAIQPYTQELEAMGIEVLYHVTDGRTPDEAIDEVLPLLDFAWICRPDLFHKYHTSLRRNASTRLIYDTIDLHFIREQRAHQALGIGTVTQWKETRETELSAARNADAVITVTDQERSILANNGIEDVHVIPTLHDLENEPAPFSERFGVLFIGSYNHTPNVDAARWLCEEIMPRLRARLGEVPLTLLGNNPPETIREFANADVLVPGYVADVGPYFRRHRVFVAPLRFGAGLKGKVGQSLAFGLPVVTSDVGAEGFGLRAGRDYLSATSAQEFAEAIERLHGDADLWARLSENSRKAIEPFSRNGVAPRVHALLRELSRVTEVA